jgi:hypothetical protein
MSRLLTSSHRADSNKLVGDASSKCKEAGGAQDRIIHNGNDDEDAGSCHGPFSCTAWKGWGRGRTASPILCPTTASTTTMDCLLPMQGRRWGMFAPPGGVADQFDHVFQMGRPDNAQSCLSPGSRADLGNVGGGGTEDKNSLMASAPMVTAALGGRATGMFG